MAARRHTARDLAQIAVFAGLVAALGLVGAIPTGNLGVPITLQTLGVMLAGAVLGARRGAAAVGVFLVLVACGLPVLSGGRGGIQYLSTAPSSGYAWGFLLGAFVTGLLTQRILPRYPLWLGILVTALGGVVAVYAVGVSWFCVVTGTPLWTGLAGTGVYLPGDAVKVVVAAVLARQVHRAYPALLADRSRRAPVTRRQDAALER